MKSIQLTRINFVGFLFTLMGVLIIAQIVRIQTSASAQSLSEEALKQYEYRKERIYPERGIIYDRWGRLLAGNKEVYEIGVNLIDVRNPETIAGALSEVLDLNYKEVLKNTSIPYKQGVSEYVILANNVEPEKIADLESYIDNLRASLANKKTKKGEITPSLRGLEWRPHLQRSYPENDLASNVLGFFAFLDREKGRPYFGIEEKYDNLLAGTPVDVTVPVDPYKTVELPSVPPGSNLILTLDREIQAMAEEQLDRALEIHGAEAGTIIVMAPKTGEILAMATTPRMNLNEYWKFPEIYPDRTPFNRAVSETYEPGSIFKIVTMAAALDSGVVKPDTPFLDTGIIQVGGINIYNWDRAAWGPQDMLGCMQHSLNVCLAWVATQLGPAKFYEYLKAFGIGHRTNIDLAGEVTWPLSIPGDESWWEANLGTNSFGQGVSVTPIQMMMAATAIANNGNMMAPRLLAAVVDSGRQYNTSPQVIGSPISVKTAQTLNDMLSHSLEEEASKALVEGYLIAGKTGTAQIPGPKGYLPNVTNASFIGWGPVDDPQFMVYVWLEKPTSSPWGAVVAAPVFRDVVRNLVILMDIPPDDARQQLKTMR